MYEAKIADLMKQIEDKNSAKEETERLKKQIADIQLLLEVDYYVLIEWIFFWINQFPPFKFWVSWQSYYYAIMFAPFDFKC